MKVTLKEKLSRRKMFMKSIWKIMFMMSLSFVILVGSYSSIVRAEENIEPEGEEISYDLQKGGTQIFSVANENSEDSYIIVEELANAERIASGSYQISFTSAGAWKAGFKVKISNNKITSAYSPSYAVITGSIRNATLVRNSDTKATYSFLYKILNLNYSTGVKARISDGKLKVSQI
jgi:hypothetical protein